MIPRRVAFLGLAALILAGAGIAAAATHTDDDDTPAAIEQPATTTTSVVPADTTTTIAATSTTVAPAPTTTVAGATTTTRRGATTTTARAATTTTTLGPAPCATAQMEARVTTNKPAYAAGEQVQIHTTLHNRGATCTYPSFVLAAAVLSPAGATVTTFDRQGETPGAIGSGQAIEAFISWDRSPLLPSGTYSVSVTWNLPGGPYTASKAFTLT